MNKKITGAFIIALLTIGPALKVSAQSSKDGVLYDQGRDMTEKSPRAHDRLDDMKALLGQWDVAVTTYPTDSTTHTANGTADITYMNRGYAYMTRVHIPDYDAEGHEANMMSFLTYNPTNETWVLGEANSYTESISMYNGDFEQGKLHLSTAVRRGGTSLVTLYRVAYVFSGDDQFNVSTSTSTDGGKHWMPASKHEYTRRQKESGFMATRSDDGLPAPNRPEETSQFDFLLGTWNASHSILLNGQWIQFPSNATAVHILNGHAILEHSWFDLDPNLPDAATTIIRLYNRATRRWESLYLNNRGNAPLFFGGQKEGNEIVLHSFESDTSSPSIPRYVFHDIQNDSYAWYANVSTDRGKTFSKTWTIAFERKD